MELLNLYLTFFKLGIVNFGGGYAMLPLLERELVNKRGWTTVDDLRDYYAVGQCTPGAIAVNVSTMIGFKRKGVLGGIVATLGFVSPAFIIIFIIASLLTNFSDNKYVAHALAGIRVVVFFLVVSAIMKLFKSSCKDKLSTLIAIVVGILAISVDAIPLYVYVIVAGILGIVINVIREKKKPVAIEVNDEDNPSSTKDDTLEDTTGNLKTKKKGSILSLIIGILCFVLLMVVCTIIAITKKDPIFFKLYFQFFKVGFLAFGGGLATIPFLQELGNATGWFSAEELANMIAVSESTPGAMGINMSTYVGYTVINNAFGNYFLSFVGSMISTLGLVTPSIVVIEIVALFLNKFKTNKWVEYAFYGLRAASIGLMIAAAYSILEISLMQNSDIVQVFKDTFDGIHLKTFFPNLGLSLDKIFNWKNIAVGTIIGITIFKYKKHPILYIACGAVLGILLWM